MQELNEKLKKYVEENILPQYGDNIAGHGREHIEDVINRCFELIQEFHLDINKNMVYTIAAFHDIGYKEDSKNHEEVSGRRFLEDEEMKKFFSEEERKIIQEAIVDHRASLEYEARSIYGKLVSSADRAISVETVLNRSTLYQKEKSLREGKKLSDDEIIQNSYKKLTDKYGKDGYAKMYYPDKKYLNFLEEMQSLLKNKELFFEKERNILKYENKKA